jgi:hypothetical protein
VRSAVAGLSQASRADCGPRRKNLETGLYRRFSFFRFNDGRTEDIRTAHRRGVARRLDRSDAPRRAVWDMIAGRDHPVRNDRMRVHA